MGSEFQGTFPDVAEGLRQRVRLNNGTMMPWLGLGMFQMRSDEATAEAVRTAIDLGYRSVDTASLYGNERGVGEAVRNCGVPREELFVTTKLWNTDMRRDRQREGFEESMDRLRLDYVDLYLLHWPIAGKEAASWEAVAGLLETGRVKAVGVSNFMEVHLERLRAVSGVVPAVNQIEYHPYLQSRRLVAYCRKNGIQVEAWSPLMQGGRVLQDPVLMEIAARHDRTVAQVILRWDLQCGVATIPKTTQRQRLRENAEAFGFELTPVEMEAIGALDRDERHGADPMDFNF